MYHLAKSIYFWATSKEGGSFPLPFPPISSPPLTTSSTNSLPRLPPEYSILLLGLDNAGKTTLLSTIKSLYNNSSPPPTSSKPTVPTVGQNVATISLDDMYLKIWDVGGQHALRSMWTSYYDVCHAIVFVVDGCDVGEGEIDTLGRNDTTENEGSPTGGRLEECRKTLESVLSHPSTANIPLLVLANKQDREDCVETVRIKEGLVRRVFEGERGGGVRDSRVLPISALRGEGVREAVEWVRSRVRWNREGRGPVMR
ncbi:hypothetical protein N7G274_008374 [Stereocaulon virgatum]|uniref:Uncharacterized protein n=1 Tax=Stereocaulon virgatum TaxID=373712 RepID=A0ABR4A386_9LECA